MEKELDWVDLYIKDFGESQISDRKELSIKQKKMRTFYLEFLLPLYKPIQDSKKFSFSVSDNELTCRIMLDDLKKYYKLNGLREVLEKISENKPSLTSEKIDKLIEVMQTKKEQDLAKTK